MNDTPVAAGKSSFDLIDLEALFSRMPIRAGARILDLACGSGRYAVELSRRLGGEGLIYAVDLWEDGIGLLNGAIRDGGIVNIRPVRADITDRLPIEAGEIDLCLMATVLHDLPPEGQTAALGEVYRVLKPGGMLALIEFKKIDRGPGPPQSVRISPEEAAGLVGRHGFAGACSVDLGEFTYLLTTVKGA